MFAALAAAATIAAFGATEPEEIALHPRGSLLLISAAAEAGDAGLTAAIGAALERRTKLAAVSGGTAGVDLARFHACPARERMSCWARTARAGSPAPFVLVAGAQPAPPERVRVSLVLLDVEHALELLAREGATAEAREDEIVTVAVRAAAGVVVAGDARELARFVDAMFVERLRDLFERSGEWGAYGTLEITVDREGLELELDGNRAGTLTAGTTRITGIDSPRLELALVDGSGRRVFERAVVVELGGVTSLDANLALAEPGPERSIALWSGAGIAAAGAAVLIYALAARPGYAAHRLCYGAACASEGAGFLSTGDLASDRAGVGESGRGGLPIAPLGYSLIALGATWAGGAWLTAEGEVPYVALAAGLLAGGASFGLSLALE